MAENSVHVRHSETALFAALSRAVSAKESGPDDLASVFLLPHLRFFIRFDFIRQRFIQKNQSLTPGAYEYLIARTAFFDQQFEHALTERMPQVVLLGAGYDSRTLRFAPEDAVTQVFELDIHTTQDRKRQCLKRAGMATPEHLHFVPIDFNASSIEVALTAAGFDRTKSTLFLWEGVSMYLTEAAVNETLDFIASCHNSRLAFDYIVEVAGDNEKNYFGVREFMTTWRKHRKGKPFQFNLPEGQLQQLLQNHGLQLKHETTSEEMQQQYLTDPQQQITGFFRLVEANTSPDQ